MKKEYVIVALVVLLLWTGRHNIPPRFQYWTTTDTLITVHNVSGQDLSDVTLVVWSEAHPLGTIKQDSVKDLKTPRLRDTTDVIIKFKYGAEPVERHLGVMDEGSDYKMNIQVNFAGVVTAQFGTALAEGSDNKTK
jgi:hypothetical protein